MDDIDDSDLDAFIPKEVDAGQDGEEAEQEEDEDTDEEKSEDSEDDEREKNDSKEKEKKRRRQRGSSWRWTGQRRKAFTTTQHPDSMHNALSNEN